MPRRNRYESNYARLETLLGCPPDEILPDRAYRYRADSFMDLVVEKLPSCEETGATVISMAHYYLQNGDLCQDPEMVLRVFPPSSTACLAMVPSTDAPASSNPRNAKFRRSLMSGRDGFPFRSSSFFD